MEFSLGESEISDFPSADQLDEIIRECLDTGNSRKPEPQKAPGSSPSSTYHFEREPGGNYKSDFRTVTKMMRAIRVAAKLNGHRVRVQVIREDLIGGKRPRLGTQRLIGRYRQGEFIGGTEGRLNPAEDLRRIIRNTLKGRVIISLHE